MATQMSEDQDEISDINIVPLVDIILVVLIIFMVASPIVSRPKMNVDLPSASSNSSENESMPFEVMISDDGSLYVAGELVSEQGLRSLAEAEFKKNSQVEAIVTADKDLPYGQVVKVMDAVKSAGIEKLSISISQSLEDSI